MQRFRLLNPSLEVRSEWNPTTGITGRTGKEEGKVVWKKGTAHLTVQFIPVPP